VVGCTELLRPLRVGRALVITAILVVLVTVGSSALTGYEPSVKRRLAAGWVAAKAGAPGIERSATGPQPPGRPARAFLWTLAIGPSRIPRLRARARNPEHRRYSVV